MKRIYFDYDYSLSSITNIYNNVEYGDLSLDMWLMDTVEKNYLNFV